MGCVDPAGVPDFLMDPTSYRYKPRRRGQAELEKRIKEICETRVRYGYPGARFS